MAHFAKLGINSKVISVEVVADNDCKNADGVEDESVGQQYLETHNNWPAQMWIQTSYNTSGNKHNSGDNSKAFRGNYAGIGYEWDEDNNMFFPKKPYASWVKNTTEARWQSPKGDAPALTAEQQTQNDAGTHRHRYEWNESSTDWELKSNL